MTIECAKLKQINIKGIIINKVPDKPTQSEKYFMDELKDFCEIPILAQFPDNNFEAFKNINL